jgi:hypothetical protein
MGAKKKYTTNTRKPIEKPKGPNLAHKRSVVGFALQVSDLHALGTTALMPEGFVNSEGLSSGQNRLQEYVTGCWFNLRDELKALRQHHPKAKVWVNCNGDATEGNHHNSKQSASIDDTDHAKAGRELLDPMFELADVASMVAGTGVHVGGLGRLETDIAKALRTREKLLRPPRNTSIAPKKDEDATPWVWNRLRYTFCGIRFQCAHHINGGQTSMARNRSVTNKVHEHYHDCGLYEETPAHYLIYSHIHSFADSGLQYGKTRGLVTGCWQFPTEFGHKIGPFRETQFGGWLIEIYDDGTTEAVKIEYPVMKETRAYSTWQPS